MDIEQLKKASKEFAEKRPPRTKELVKGARIQGEMRVSGGGEEGRERDETLRNWWKDDEAVKVKWDGLLKEPFSCSSLASINIQYLLLGIVP